MTDSEGPTGKVKEDARKKREEALPERLLRRVLLLEGPGPFRHHERARRHRDAVHEVAARDVTVQTEVTIMAVHSEHPVLPLRNDKNDAV